ncbi:MAG: HD domain-containing protein, partial [Candidatus Pacebacteria bacterium]|nr:HD domain-containing protein [Candidatus Paceibacterota bacterium]
MRTELKALRRKIKSPELFEEILHLLNQAAFRPLEEKAGDNIEKSFLISHCLRVGALLAEMNCSRETIIGGMIFQLQEEGFHLNNLSQGQQKEVWEIVSRAKRLKQSYGHIKDLKTKPIKEWQKTLLDQQAENLRKSFFALAKDLRPILVLIADKLDELKHLVSHYSQAQQKKQAIISLEIMAPLCYGLGIAELKGQFEDLSFPIIFPKEYKWLIDHVKDRYEQTRIYTEKFQPQIKKFVESKGIKPIEVSSRAKRYFSLYQKLLRHDMDIEKIYDLVAMRIIVQTVEECYQVLSILHKNYKPLPNRTKDYIAKPKINGYQAIHTTISGPENKFIEIQIKTAQMNKEAEFGIAAHLSYKGKFSSKTYKYQFYWLEQLRKWRDES